MTALVRVVWVVLVLLLGACGKQQQEPAPETPPPVIPESEIKRAVDACEAYVTRVCKCAETVANAKEPCALAKALPESIGEPPQVGRVLREVGESFLNFQVVAKREAEVRAELSAAPEVVAAVPYFDHDITDLAGLLDLGQRIWK